MPRHASKILLNFKLILFRVRFKWLPVGILNHYLRIELLHESRKQRPYVEPLR